LIGGVILAAGAGRRFGGPKQLASFAGRPLLERPLRNVAACASVDSSIVVLGAHAERILERIDRHGAKPVICETWRQGQAESLRTGLEALGDAEAAVVVLGDQPLISPRAIERVVAARDGKAMAVRATYGGAPGHPVLLERAIFGALKRVRGDVGARAVLDTVAVQEVACDDAGEPFDIDTPEDLGKVRSRG